MYDFLNNLELVDTHRKRQPKQTNPTGLVLRIYPNGEVYPSLELVKRFKLQYKNKDANHPGFGIDVVDSLQWTPVAHLPRMILFGITPRTEAKIDLLASCRHNEETLEPKSDVMSQGTVSVLLLNLVRSMGYLTEEQVYCDLQVVIDKPIYTKDNIYNLPKLVERGDRKGDQTYERRENIVLYPVNIPENLVEEQVKIPTEQVKIPIPEIRTVENTTSTTT